MKYIIIIIEALFLSLIFYFRLGTFLPTVFLVPIAYLLIGIVHGQIFKENKGKAFFFVVLVGALVGVFVTVISYIVGIFEPNTMSNEGAGFAWFMPVLIGSIFAYSINPLGWITAMLGIFLSPKIMNFREINKV